MYWHPSFRLYSLLWRSCRTLGLLPKGRYLRAAMETTIVKTHEIVAMVPRCLCHPGNHFQVPVRQRESPQSHQKTHQWTLNHWTRQHHRHLVFKAPSKNHIAGKLHIIALQEAMEYLLHECLTSHFQVTHYGGCGILFQQRHIPSWH